MLSTWQWSRVTSDVCGTVLVGNDSVDVSEGEDGMSTNAESNMRPITRITVKMVAEHRDDTAGLEDYSAVDKSCMVVAADPLSLIALSP